MIILIFNWGLVIYSNYKDVYYVGKVMWLGLSLGI